MKHEANWTRHGSSYSRPYRIWAHMIQRCHNPNNPGYKSYGGRGIKVCDEWRTSFVSFRDWALSHGYDDSLTIDRIDNNLGYFPDNCRWADSKTQKRNYRRNQNVTFKGETHCLMDWANILGISYQVLRRKIVVEGMSPEEAFSKSSYRNREDFKANEILTYNGESHSVDEWAKITGLRYDLIRKRIFFTKHISRSMGEMKMMPSMRGIWQ